MTPEVRTKIEQIRHGNVPKGYKPSKLGIIPENWITISLGELGESKNGLNFHRDDEGYTVRVLGVGDFKDRSVMHDVETLTEVSLSSPPDCDCLLHDGDIVFVRSNGSKELVGRNLLVYPENAVVSYSGFCIRYRMQNIDLTTPEYVNFILDSGVLKKKLQKENQGSNISNLNQDILSELTIALPIDKKEQAKILQLLETQNKVIELKEKLLAQKQRQKKHLMQQLLTGKKRLNGHLQPWKLCKLSEILKEGSKERVADTSHYKKMTVKLNFNGLEYTSSTREMADTRPFYVRRAGEIIIGKQNYFNGSIALVTEDFDGCICSNAIMSFSVHSANIDFVVAYLSQVDFLRKHEMLANGTGQKELSEKDFLNFTIMLPNVEEQNAIADLLITANKEINLLHQDLEQEKQKKKALMQLLLTGIVRV